MKLIYKLATIATLVAATTACQTTSKMNSDLGYNKGDVVQALVNIHVDSKGNRINTLNYQLANVVPVCSEFTIDSVGPKVIKLTANGAQYSYILNKHTSRAGQSLADNFNLFFGDKCDNKKISNLNKLDTKGIKQGKALLGMSKEGVLFAMGYPPIHANPTMENNNWLYWRNRFGKRAIEFSEQGKVIKIK